MELASEQHGDVTVVRPSGRLNMAAAPALREVIGRCADAGPARIVVDLAGVTFVYSSGLGALISGLKTARQSGGDLRIAAPTNQAATVLSLTNLDRVLRPFATVEQAVDGW